MATNTIVTNERTSLVLLRFLAASPYLTVGSKKYFSDNLVGMRDGDSRQFVIRDHAPVKKGLNQSNTLYAADSSAGSPTTAFKAKASRYQLVEKKVTMTLEDFNISVATDAVERYTSLNWEDEVAKPQGGALSQDVTRNYVTANFPKAATAIIGTGFQPLAEAGAYLEEISSEKVFGFVDSKFQAILTANGQQFNPVGSPSEFYSKGLLGTFHDVEYRSQRFIPKIKVAAATKSAIEGATAAVLAFSNGKATLTLTLAKAAQLSFKAGTPIAIDGLYACDLLGDVTDSPFYFIVGEDYTMPSSGTSCVLPIGNLLWESVTKSGTRIFAQEDGSDFADVAAVNTFIAAQIADNKPVTTPLDADAMYYNGQLRLDGAMEFETLNKFDASNAETKAGEVAGYMMFENRVVDIDEMINDTRWDVVAMAGIVDPRACVNVYSKA
jgi:hypothetical protein